MVFGRQLFALNYASRHPTRLQVSAFGISVLSGTLYWISLNTVRGGLALQLSSTLLASTTSWSVLVLLVNQTLQLPTRQQWMSLGFYLFTDLSYLTQMRLTFA